MKKWETAGTLLLRAEHGDRLLAVHLTPLPGFFDEWAVIALEIGKPPDKITAGSIQRVLDEHAHKDLGMARGLRAAMARAEKYATAWQRDRAERAPACECGEIEAHEHAIAGA